MSLSERRLAARALCLISAFLAFAASGCPGTGLTPRFAAVHNTLESMGYSQLGHISMGSLPEGQSVRLPVRLEQGACYSFLGMGGEGVSDTELALRSPAGDPIASDDEVDAQSSLYHCAESTGPYSLTFRLASGSGEYMVAAWTGAGTDAGPRRVAAARPTSGPTGSCGNPIPLTADESVSGDSSTGQSALAGTCAEGVAPEIVYSFQLQERAQVSLRVESSYDGVLYIQQECGQQETEVGCNDDAPDTAHSQVDAVLDAGTYYAVVDGYNGNRGTFTLIMSTRPGQPVAEVCADAPALLPGMPVQGSTVGQNDNFRATCGNGAHSPDRAYRLEVQQPSRLRVGLQTLQHDGVLHMRRACEDASSELQCNDDLPDRQHSLLRQLVDPGTYFVFADGYAAGAAGDFTLQADLASRAGGGAPADACASPGTITGAGVTQGDTFAAADDLQPSCGPLPGGPDQVYRLDVARRSRARLALDRAEFQNGAIAVMRTCGDRATEVACGIGTLDTILPAGSYSVAVDGNGADSFGRYDLTVALEDTAQMEAACRSARPLRPGRSVTGTTAAPDRFQASCGSSAMSGESIHKLVVRRRSRVRLAVQAGYDAVLYVRRDCMDRASEMQCNDDNPDQQHSLVEAVFDPGTYWVFVDGYGPSSNGSYTLETTVAPATEPASATPPVP